MQSPMMNSPQKISTDKNTLPMIVLHDVSYGFGSRRSDRGAAVPVLEGMDARFERGGFYAVMGANGCGKTTLLRLVAGMLVPQTGSVTVEGRDVRLFSARELAQRMAFVRQHPQTDFEFSAFETVLMGRNPYQRRLQNESEEDWHIVEECMRQTNTWHLRFAKPGEMSGGELQRVMLARALAQRTPIMLLDEPISNLDIAHQFEILELLRRVNHDEGKTILLVVHDLNMALRYCDKVLLLHHGGVLFQGPIAEGLTPQNIRTVFGVEAERVDADGQPLLRLTQLNGEIL